MADTFGLKIKNASGVTTLDITDNFTRILGDTVVTSNGSLVVPEGATSTLWVITLDLQTVATGSSQSFVGRKVNATTISWSADYAGIPGRPTRIVWGVF